MTTKGTKIKVSKNGGKESCPLEDEVESEMSEAGGEFEGIEDEKEEDDGSEDESAEEDEDVDNDEEGVPLSDVDLDAAGDDVDVIPYQKIFKDNHAALTQALSTFALPWASLPFHAHQSVTAGDVTIDVNDDLSRELAFYKQALEAAQEARTKLLAEEIPFARPSDYFAEMIKDDEHMEKIRNRIVEEEATKNASEAAKRQRDLKKFGKKVQVSKLQEREKQRGAVLDKIKALKRKRQDGNMLTTEDDFDVELEEASRAEKGHRSKLTRERRNEKYGYGGSKKKFKRNDDDAGDLSMFGKRSKGGFKGKRGKQPQRPGKQRRMQQRR